MPAPRPERPTTNGTHRSPAGHGGSLLESHADLARRLLAHELGIEMEPPGLLSAAGRVSQKLCRRLSRLASPVGSQAIVSRALHLARRQVPFLEGVGVSPDGDLLGLEETLRDIDTDEARQGLITVLTSLIDLLVGFIGDELTVRLLGDVWPELLLNSIQPGKSGGQEAAP